MTRWLVMPRGINVGRNNRVPMADLRTELGRTGFEEIITIGQSGNIIVSRKASEQQVCASVRSVMAEAFDVDVPVVVRCADEIREVLDANPLGEIATDGSKYLVIFLSAAPTPQQAATLEAEDLAPEVVSVVGRDVFVWAPDGVKAMKFSHTALEKRFGVTATARNWNTLEKIVVKL